MLRDAVSKLCRKELRLDVVAEAESGLAGAALVAKHQPDVLLLDLWLPELDGFSVIERVRQTSPHTKIIVVSAYIDDFTLSQIDAAAVQGFVDKNTEQMQAIKAALIAVSEGKSYFSGAFEKARRHRVKDPGWFTKLLSRAEVGVLSLIGRGLNNTEIAARLGISPRTAQTHRTNILGKLKVRGTPKLMMFAQRHGFAGHTVNRADEDGG